jgi:hypothetical protein
MEATFDSRFACVSATGLGSFVVPDEKLSEALLNAHATTTAGQQKLNDIQKKIVEAVNNPSMDLDTAAGEKSYLIFLRNQVSAINDLLASGSLSAADQSKAAQALAALYAADKSGGNSDPGAPPGTPAPPATPAPDPGASVDPGITDPGLGPPPDRLVHRGDHDRALTDGRGDPFDRSGSHVTDSENAGTAGGQRLRQRLRVRRVVGDGRCTRAHKSFVVQGDATEPLGVGRGPEHEKHIRNMAGLGLPGNPVAPGNGVQVPLAIQRGDLGVRMHGDACRRRLDATDEVIGHARRQSVAAHQNVHMVGQT